MSRESNRQKFVARTLTSMIHANHLASHHDSNCPTCKAIQSGNSGKTETAERRRVDRVNFHVRVVGETGSGRFETNLLDLSDCGAFLESVLAFPVGTPITLKFKIDSASIVVPAEVRYSIEHVGFGVRFVDLKEDDWKRIARFVSRSARAER